MLIASTLRKRLDLRFARGSAVDYVLRLVDSAAQVVGMPGTGGGDNLVGSQGGVDDRSSACHVNRLEALYDGRGHLADLRRQLDGPIQQLGVCDDLGDQTDLFGAAALMTSPVIESRRAIRSRQSRAAARLCQHRAVFPSGRECREHRSAGRHEEVAAECHLQVQLVERGKELPNALAHVGHRERRAKPAHPAQAIGDEPVVAPDRNSPSLREHC
jgi:hypothetical protein